MNVGIVGLGWWGKTLVESVQQVEGLSCVAAVTRSRSERDREYADAKGVKLFDSLEAMLSETGIGAVVLASPPSTHCDQIVAATAAGKHIFCEKPFVMTLPEARRAIDAVRSAGVTLAIGYNRRFHPCWKDLKRRIGAGELGTILHIECTMSGPNGLTLPESAWRASETEAPCGGLLPMGVHAIDGFVDLVGSIDRAFCQSFRRAVPNNNDDTTSVLFRMRHGMSAYLGTMMATSGTFRLQVYGTKGTALLGGSVHVAGQSSQQRRTGLFGSYLLQPVKGDARELEVPAFDVNRAELEAFVRATSGGESYPISYSEMMHVVAATDAVIRSARSGNFERVEEPDGMRRG